MSPSSSSVIIFDWDDTICPSSFVDQAQVDNYKDLPKHYHSLFHEVGKCAEKCLAAAAKHGEVIIITNSDEGWVNYSAERYVPNLIPVLKNYRIVSARTRYEKFYPNQPLCWKAAAFAHEVNEHFSANDEAEAGRSILDRECEAASCGDDSSDAADMVSTDGSSMEDSVSSLEDSKLSLSPPSKRDGSTKHSPPVTGQREIISFGDSMEERTAVKIVSGQLDATPKSVMFLSLPTPAQIIGQLTMLTHHMSFVCDHASELDLEISEKQADKCAQSYLERNKERKQQAAPAPSLFQRLTGTGSASNPPASEANNVDMDGFVC